MNRRLFLASTTLGFTFAASGASFADDADDAQAMVRRISDEMLSLVRSPSGEAAKRAEFVGMMDRYSNMRQIAGFALGRYRLTMPEALKDRYIEAFKRFVAATYVGMFSDYDGETIDVGTARPTEYGYAVSTTVNRGAQPPMDVRWELSTRSGRLLVEDFVVEGISMATSQRGEFTSLIASYGGDLEKFIAYLESRG